MTKDKGGPERRVIRMARRTANVTETELKRALKAIKAAGLYVVGVVPRGEDYWIEVSDEPVQRTAATVPKPTPVL